MPGHEVYGWNDMKKTKEHGTQTHTSGWHYLCFKSENRG